MSFNHGNKHGSVWTEEHDAAHSRHLDAGMSHAEAAAAINAEFGTTFTRNSSIGRAHRTGKSSKSYAKNGNHKRKRVKRMPKLKRKDPTPQMTCEEVAPRTVDVVPLNLPLLELGPNDCRWPTDGSGWESPYLFCANPKLEEISYCWEHFQLSLRQRVA